MLSRSVSNIVRPRILLSPAIWWRWASLAMARAAKTGRVRGGCAGGSGCCFAAEQPPAIRIAAAVLIRSAHEGGIEEKIFMASAFPPRRAQEGRSGRFHWGIRRKGLCQRPFFVGTGRDLCRRKTEFLHD